MQGKKHKVRSVFQQVWPVRFRQGGIPILFRGLGWDRDTLRFNGVNFDSEEIINYGRWPYWNKPPKAYQIRIRYGDFQQWEGQFLELQALDAHRRFFFSEIQRQLQDIQYHRFMNRIER